MKTGDIVVLTGVVVDNNKCKGYVDIACGKRSQGIQIFRLNKSILSSVVENINDIIVLGKRLEKTFKK